MTQAGESAPHDEDAAMPTFTATSLSGSLSVRTTEQGLPVGVRVARNELHRDPTHLAADILRLCQRAANRAGLARREELAAAGLSAQALALTGLPTEQDVAAQEIMDEDEYDAEPQSWLRSV